MSAATSNAKKTREEILREHAFKPGNPGGPGRAKGSRNKLGEAFVEALHDDFLEHGAKAIIDAREESPIRYLNVVASVIPREVNVRVGELDELTDEQLERQLTAIAAQLSNAGFEITAGKGPAPAQIEASGLSTVQ